MDKKIPLLAFAVAALDPAFPQARSSLYPFGPQPPLLSEFRGEVYRVPVSDLEDRKGEVSWQRFSSTAIPGNAAYLNAERRYTVRHRLAWRLVQPPTRYSTDTKIEQQVFTGYAQQAMLDLRLALDLDKGVELLGLSPADLQALKLDKAEIDAWQPGRVDPTELSRRGRTTYCAWALIDDLAVEVAIRTSVGGKDQDPSGAPVTVRADLPVVLKVVQDEVSDPDGEILAKAARTFAATTDLSAVGSPVQR